MAAAAGGVVVLVLVAVAVRHYWPAPAATETVQKTPPAPVATAPPQASAPSRETAPQVTTPTEPPASPAPPPPVLTAEAVTPVLAGVPCSALISTVRGSALEVQGYVAKSFGVPRLKEVLSAVPGLTSVNADVQLVSDEKCGVLKLFAPYWVGNRQHGMAASIHTKQANAEFTEGDFLILDLKTPGYDSFVNVDYYAFDGSIVHMVPSPRIKGNQAPPNYTATIGGGGNWVVSKPFGTDFIVLLVTPVPLFDGMRNESEIAQDYLRDVEKKLQPMAAKYGPEKIAVDFVQVTTRPRNK
jgi:eukaryotic-like serine/threonine-protein kinase